MSVEQLPTLFDCRCVQSRGHVIIVALLDLRSREYKNVESNKELHRNYSIATFPTTAFLLLMSMASLFPVSFT